MGLMSETKPIFTACDVLGGAAALARLLGIKPQTVTQWRSGKRRIPASRCHAIEKATKGKVTRRDLRPDDFHLIWPELARNKKQAA